MHPVGLVGLARADDYDQVRQICEMYSVSVATLESQSDTGVLQDYKPLFDTSGAQVGEKTLEDKFFEYEVCRSQTCPHKVCR
jgi:V-type H+-transporting ATPase subunit d